MEPLLLREFIETDLSDAALQLYIDAEQEQVDQRLGSGQDSLRAFGTKTVILRSPATSITEVTTRAYPDQDPVTLSANDYRLFADRQLIRNSDGDNPASCWHGEIVITYEQLTDESLTQRVIVDLVKLAIEFKGVKGEKVGDTSTTFADYQVQRESILRQLAGNSAILA